MRLISAKEYAERKGLSVGYVYSLIRSGKIATVEHQMTVKRIPFDDIKNEHVNIS